MNSRNWVKVLAACTGVLLASTGAVLAEGAGGAGSEAPVQIDTGDTAWVLTSTVLVLMMTIPALALFYGGLVRSKNVLSTLMHSLFCAALISVTWVLYGYSLAFGESQGGLVGGLNHLGLSGVMGQTEGTIPLMLFVMFQGTFAIITAALISGAFAERMRFPAFALFILLWSAVIYCPLAHWVWGDGGWIEAMGALDFAGGTVVHISSGITALVTAIFIGRRLGYGQEAMPPHNLPFTVMGAALLWVGWFGFNAGSALGSNEEASVAFVNTNTAAAAAALGWLLVEWLRTGKPTILGAASGAVAGLVCITPAAGFVTPMAAVAFGLAGGVICYAAVTFKPRLGYDDALDVVGIHLVGGTIGALLTGVFATEGGLIYGGGAVLLGKQAVAVAATYAFCGAGSLVILLFVNALFKLRATQEEEMPGLDISQHSERAYHLGGGESVAFVGPREPRPASIPPMNWDRYTIAVEGVEPNALAQHWQSLCHDNGSSTPEFKTVYAHVGTIRGNRFRFRGGDRDRIRRNLEHLFKPVAPAAAAIVQDAHEPETAGRV